jgi:CRP-like cAMP-binding protein
VSLELAAPPRPTAPAERSLIRLLDHDADLARHFDANQLPKASAAITVAARQAPAGPWTPPASRPEGMIGFLVLDGSILRDVSFGGRSCAHLIGPGDVLDPWMQMDVSPCGTARYRIVEDAQLAILNTRFVRNAAPWPQVLPAVMERLVRQHEQILGLYALALLPRVDTRIVAFFWHLAQRWGRVGRDGVIIPLDLTHRTLGELVGGRRPTISVALAELDQAGMLSRRPDGSWALSRDSWQLLADTPCPVDPTPVLGTNPAA